MICFDVEFLEVARVLALAGTDLPVTLSANMAPFGRDHDVFATAHALENGLPHMYTSTRWAAARPSPLSAARWPSRPTGIARLGPAFPGRREYGCDSTPRSATL
jgi:predicted amidohydrolase